MRRCVHKPMVGGLIHDSTNFFQFFFSICEQVFFIWRLKCTIGIGTSRFVLYREVLFIQSVLYQRFHCAQPHYIFDSTMSHPVFVPSTIKFKFKHKIRIITKYGST